MTEGEILAEIALAHFNSTFPNGARIIPAVDDGLCGLYAIQSSMRAQAPHLAIPSTQELLSILDVDNEENRRIAEAIRATRFEGNKLAKDASNSNRSWFLQDHLAFIFYQYGISRGLNLQLAIRTAPVRNELGRLTFIVQEYRIHDTDTTDANTITIWVRHNGYNHYTGLRDNATPDPDQQGNSNGQTNNSNPAPGNKQSSLKGKPNNSNSAPDDKQPSGSNKKSSNTNSTLGNNQQTNSNGQANNTNATPSNNQQSNSSEPNNSNSAPSDNQPSESNKKSSNTNSTSGNNQQSDSSKPNNSSGAPSNNQPSDLNGQPNNKNVTPKNNKSPVPGDSQPKDSSTAAKPSVILSPQYEYQIEFRHANCARRNERIRRQAMPGRSYFIDPEEDRPIDCVWATPVEINIESNDELQVCQGGCNEGNRNVKFEASIAERLRGRAQTFYESAHSNEAQVEIVGIRIVWSEATTHSSALTSEHLALIQNRGNKDTIQINFRSFELPRKTVETSSQTTERFPSILRRLSRVSMGEVSRRVSVGSRVKLYALATSLAVAAFWNYLV